MRLLKKTLSLCPCCLKRIEAFIVEKEGTVFMEKSCAEHGFFSTLIWEDSGENYLRWLGHDGMSGSEPADCPKSCGLCAEHKSASISAALMVTTECDLRCPICFTRGGESHVPSLEELKRRLDSLDRSILLEMCGGEPTTRDDLPEIVSMASGMGFSYIQLNTNGIRIAREPLYLNSLAEAGLTTVYMGLDGVRVKPYMAKSGRDIMSHKLAAIENCRDADLAVVLVPCIIPGENSEQLGEILELAKTWMPTVKGVYFQPVSYFGVYPKSPDDSMRITIPRIMRLLEEQAKGEVPQSAFLPGNYEHPACSFSGVFGKVDGKLVPYTRFQKRTAGCNRAEELRLNSARMWKPGALELLSIGGMAFQDVWNIDLQRLCKCTIHIIGADGKRYPLCAKYLTSCSGKRLYPNIS